MIPSRLGSAFDAFFELFLVLFRQYTIYYLIVWDYGDDIIYMIC